MLIGSNKFKFKFRALKLGTDGETIVCSDGEDRPQNLEIKMEENWNPGEKFGVLLSNFL